MTFLMSQNNYKKKHFKSQVLYTGNMLNGPPICPIYHN